MQQNSDLIHFSRAGDIFHYRWAVKRCLKLLDFNNDLSHITIEGSLESELAGECVVDLAEYRKSENGDMTVEYFQLKHSTVRAEQPFTLSKLRETIEGFAKRFSAIESTISDIRSIKLTVLTNRLISGNFKRNIKKIANGEKAPTGFTQTIEGYTKLKGKKLKQFCMCLNLCDSEGDYDEQKYDIHKELAKLSVSKNNLDREKLLVAKVWEKIEPGKSNIIKREDMLEAFDVSSFDDFFPAPPLFEQIDCYIPRDEQTSIVSSIKSAKTHTIITASGGVGKSILSSNLYTEFDSPSIVIAYDCFGNGSYRRVSAKRHEAKHAITQVINMLAKDGLCDQILPIRNEPDEYWIKAFLNRIREVCTGLSSIDERAFLVIIFDAADNAEMAAEEQGSKCFASQLLREVVPGNCRLVFTCRPERLELLDPPEIIKPICLSPFSNREAFANLQVQYRNPTLEQATEFNRLTGGNPRVQSSVLSLKISSLNKLLLSFGSKVVTVEDLIERQLEASVARIKDSFPKDYRQSIDNICTGLAVLPPFVPIKVLAKTANVSPDSIKSFIADLGHPLWQIDDTVQFRDEPTEKWFQDNFSATPHKIYSFVKSIKSLANEFPYVAESLPLLLLKAEQLDELVELALSDNYLPSISTFDDNLVRVQRLQHAFKAALKANRLFEAVKLALMAGEEIAGNDRQIDILINNVDLTSLFLSSGRIQELAHRKELIGEWDGSETVFSASLLSGLQGMKGEAYSYFRSAEHWLHRYFEKRKNVKEERPSEKLNDIEIIELAFAQYRINGWEKCSDFLLSWRPQSCIFRITSKFIERLIDGGELKNIALMASYGKSNSSFILAITSELMKLGKTPPRNCLTRCLNQIINPNSRLDKPDDIRESNYTVNAYLSFFEACLIHQLPLKNIRRGLSYYYEIPHLYRVADDHQYKGGRENFLRYLSIQAVIKEDFDLNFEKAIPSFWSSERDYEGRRKLERAKETIAKLLPWYMVKAKILSGLEVNLQKEHEAASCLASEKGYSSYREYDPIPFEITKVKFQNILFCNSNYMEELELFDSRFGNQNIDVSFMDSFYFLRASCRVEKLHRLSDVIEEYCYSSLKNHNYEESPEERSELLIKLSRAVLSLSKEDASYYFDEALSKASNFGQEGVLRWEALTSIAKRSAESEETNPELAHRYMRCAEMIGDSVSREKYWDRNDTISTCFQISPVSAFLISSRWKDRYVGWSDRQIYPLALSAIDSELATPASLWALSSFSWEYGLIEFLEKCLSKETSKSNQQKMLDYFINDLRVKGYQGDKWLKVKELALEYDLNSVPEREFKCLLAAAKTDNLHSSTKPSIELESPKYQWDKLYGKFDLLTDAGFIEAYQFYKKQGYPREYEKFWQGCYNKITSRGLSLFLNIISQSVILDFYDLHFAFKEIPDAWKKKPSLKSAWNETVKYVASRYPQKFTEINQRNYLIGGFILDDKTNSAIREGVIEGHTNSVDIESAEALFNFAHYNASSLTIAEAKELIDYGLNRLEVFLGEDYADGSWDKGNTLPKDLSHALVCYIFANLGSPHAEVRWRAVHSVIRLCHLNCINEINLLVRCYREGISRLYIPNKHVFYDLHAKLYLLVALTKCAQETPEALVNSKSLFLNIALNKKQGILFQYYAKKICLSLQKYNSNCFDKSTFEKVMKICLTQYPTINEKQYDYQADSPLHKIAKKVSLPEVYFAYDFDRFWFEPLGEVFGISSSQVQDLAKNILVNQWGVEVETPHLHDSRATLWKGRRYSRDVFHSHSNYPSIDNYSFYISYHLLLEVASQLLESMPVIYDVDYKINMWDEWINQHLILSNDNFLLSELRDPMPINKPNWVNDKYDENWLWHISDADFIDHLFLKDKASSWLNVEGSWDEFKEGRNESVSFSSVLVSKHLSQSLLTTINLGDHLNESYLYNYCESGLYSVTNEPFQCKKWLNREEQSYEIESGDPFAGTIYPQPYKLGECITKIISVESSPDLKTYNLSSDNSVCFRNKYWSEDKPSDSESNISSGKPVLASLKFLQTICDKLNVDIAIQVTIKRSFTDSYRKKDDKLGYIPRYGKTFILSGDGKLRDSRKSYQLR